jgi:hypothetical protein
MPPGGKSILPNAKDINSLLAALPKLNILTIATKETDIDSDIDSDSYKTPKTKALMKMRENLAPALLKALSHKGCPTSRLEVLNLHDCFLDGAILVKVLLAHKISLDRVQMSPIKLKDGQNPVEWRDIFEVMLGMFPLKKLVVENVFNPGESEYLILNDDCYQEQHEDQLLVSYQDWAEVKLRANGEYGESRGMVTGYAHHHRTKILFVESHVKSGLEMLTETGEVHLLWDPEI